MLSKILFQFIICFLYNNVLFQKLPEELSQEEFALFLEAKLKIEETPKIVISKSKQTAVVEFNSPIGKYDHLLNPIPVQRMRLVR